MAKNRVMVRKASLKVSRPVLAFIVFPFLALTACKRPIEGYEHPNFDAVPSLIAILVADKPINAYVSFARDMNSVHPSICDNAQVSLFVNGEWTETLSYDIEQGLYRSSTIAQSGYRYDCKVAIPGYDTLFATTSLPLRPVIIGLDKISNLFVDDEGDLQACFFFSFRTNPHQDLFYEAEIQAIRYVIDEDTGIGRWRGGGRLNYSYQPDDPLLLHEGSDRLTFSNEIIHDSTYTLKINELFGNNEVTGSYVAKLNGLSEEYYQFLKSCYNYNEMSGQEFLFIGTIPPINFFSNVKNGYGIWAGMTPALNDTTHFGNEH